MHFEWDEHKRRANLDKHGIDFLDARLIWRQPVLDPAETRMFEGEVRPATLGIIGKDALIIAVVYTARQGVIRLISARRARRNERRRYQDRFGRGI